MKRLLAAVIFLFPAQAFPQSAYENDAQAWLKLTVEKKLSDRFSIRLYNQYRFSNNISEFGRMRLDLSATYKLGEPVRVRAGYSFIERRRLSGIYSQRHRVHAALLLRKDIRRWSLRYRNLSQMQYNEPFTSEDGDIARLYNRHKITLQYEYSKYIFLYAAQELFIPLNNPQARGFDQSRSFLGLLYNLTKKQQLEVFFLLRAGLQNGEWHKQRNKYPNEPLNRDFVYGVGYSFEF